MSIEGFYRAFYTGREGNGFNIFVLMNGKLAGADVAGGTLRGNYKLTETGAHVSCELSLPHGAVVVFDGSTVGPGGMSLPIEFDIDSELGGGNPVRVDTVAGPVNIIFQKISEL